MRLLKLKVSQDLFDDTWVVDKRAGVSPNDA
jgi:hypothetical protein